VKIKESECCHYVKKGSFIGEMQIKVKFNLIIRYFSSRQKRQEYNWQQIDFWAFRSSVFGLLSQCPFMK